MNNVNQKQQDFQRNMQLQRIAQEKKAIAVSIIEKAMATDLLQVENISQRWRTTVRKAILNTAPIMYQAKLVDYAKAVLAVKDIDSCTWNGKITLIEFQTIANSLDAISPAALGLEEEEYVEVINESIAMQKVWNDQIVQINSGAMILAEEEYKAKAMAKGETTDGQKLSAVKGEA